MKDFLLAALFAKLSGGGGGGGNYIPKPTDPADGAFLTYNAANAEWQATTVPEANGEDF